MRSSRTSRRHLLHAATGTLGAGAIAACGLPGSDNAPTASNEPVTLRVLLPATEVERLRDNAPVLQTFEAAFPTTKVDVEVSVQNAGAEHYDKLLARIASGDPVEMSFVASDEAAQFIKQGSVRDLRPLLAKQRAVSLNDYWKGVVDGLSYQGKLGGLAYSVFTELLWFNQDLLAQAGQAVPNSSWTWDTLLAAARAVTRPASEGQTPQWGFTFPSNIRTMGFPFIWAFGGKLFDNDQEPKSLMTDPAAAEGLQWLVDTVLRHKVAPTAEEARAVGATNVNLTFRLGKTALYVTTAAFRAQKTEIGTQFRFDCARLPSGKSGRIASTWSSGLVLPVTGKLPDRTLPLITYITGPNGQRMFTPLGVQMPSVESITRSKEWLEADGLNRQSALDTILQARPLPSTPAWGAIMRDALNPFWNELIAGRKTALDGLREIRPKVDELLRAV